MLSAPCSPAPRSSRFPARGARRFAMLLTASLMLLALPLGAAAMSSPDSGKDDGDSSDGVPLSLSIDVDSGSDPGKLVITVSVGDGDVIGDLRGVFFQVADESLLGGLSVMGKGVTSSQFSANDVINLGNGANLKGGESPCPCDIGVEIGSAGIGSDDFQTVTFTLMHVSESLGSDFLRKQAFGVRVTSVGEIDGDREGSAKLVGIVPEPTTAILMLLGLAGLTVVGTPSARRG